MCLDACQSQAAIEHSWQPPRAGGGGAGAAAPTFRLRVVLVGGGVSPLTSSSRMLGPMGHSSMHSCCSIISTPVPTVGWGWGGVGWGCGWVGWGRVGRGSLEEASTTGCITLLQRLTLGQLLEQRQRLHPALPPADFAVGRNANLDLLRAAAASLRRRQHAARSAQWRCRRWRRP